MPTYAFVSAKGGPGKSTLSLNFASWLARTGQPVVLLDADISEDIVVWGQARRLAEIAPAVTVIPAPGALMMFTHNRLLREADPKLCIVIDVGGRYSQELTDAIDIANVAVVPALPGSFFDFAGAKKTAGYIDYARRAKNPMLHALGVLNKVRPNVPADVEITAQAFADLPALPLARTTVGLRAPFGRNLHTGQSVLDNPSKSNRDAAREVCALAEEIVSLCP